MRDLSSLVLPMSNVMISYEPLTSMILSKIADSRPESIRWPSASIVSVTDIGSHCTGCSASSFEAATSLLERFLPDELIADAADCQQDLRRAGPILDVAPKPHDEVVDGAGVGPFVQPPHFFEQCATGDRLPRISHQVLQQIALHLRQPI